MPIQYAISCERGVRMNTKYRVQKFWSFFLMEREVLEEALKDGQTSEIKRILTNVNDQLRDVCACKIEVEMSENGFFEMTFDSAGDKSKQYICALLQKDAPQALREDWIINAFTQPLSEKAMHSVLDINGIQYSGADFKVYYTIEEQSKTLSLQLYCEGLKGLEEDRKQSIVAYMLELFIGELEFEARISSVTILDEEIEEENVCLLPNLYEDICDIIVDCEWMEYHDPLAIYQAYKIDEKPVSETLRNDRKLIITTHPHLQEELFQKQYEICKDFKMLGGEYGFLYYEVLYDDEKEAIMRQQLEKEITDLLYPMSIARTMGGAIGEYYSYIDVAIFDIDAFEVALEKINEKLTFEMYYKGFI